MKQKYLIVILLLSLFIVTSAQHNIYNPVKTDEIESSLKDIGKMWTFDDIPFEYWETEYNFKPTEEWLEKAKKSALQFGRGCSGAFVSSDGLIMTNHHCGRDVMLKVQKENEDLFKTGFYAETLQEERKIPNLFVDQLVLIEDVTNDVLLALHSGETNEEKLANRDTKMRELEAEYREETGLLCSVVTLYNGGKYSLYGYKRYTDIRLVMAPDFQIASTGWDWDNFTYPRYELDFMFFRAYEDGEPLYTDNYFKWSAEGAEAGEPVFVIGRPGNTDRLLSYAQLEYFRDVRYPATLKLLNGLYNTYYELFEKYPERESELLNRVMGIGNGRKVYAGMLLGLKDEYLMARKKHFDNQLQAKVKEDEELNKVYGHLWEGLESNLAELAKYYPKSFVYNTRNWGVPEYFKIANKIIKLANQLKLKEEEREDDYKADKLDETISKIFPDNFDTELQTLLLKAHTELVLNQLQTENPIVKAVFKDLKGMDAVNSILERSSITSKEKVIELAKKSPDEILNSNDPFIYFIQNTKAELANISGKIKEVQSNIGVFNQMLGEVVFDLYGDQIPPDATSTLRITDGVIKGYEYNGTLAPPKTTYYGMYDRYNSFGKKTYPWGLNDNWKNPPAGLDLTTPVNIATTTDIVGGNSGSSMINSNLEVVGLVFDGNLESLPGSMVYLPEKNRTVAVDSKGLLEALKHVYKTEKLVKELINGQIVE
ncbi:MAG: S46 family peptidase [Melioribacteraceae bacterium]|nr:S46 family peptidase [Melioribacteraceae bacterium]